MSPFFPVCCAHIILLTLTCFKRNSIFISKFVCDHAWYTWTLLMKIHFQHLTTSQGYHSPLEFKNYLTYITFKAFPSKRHLSPIYVFQVTSFQEYTTGNILGPSVNRNKLAFGWRPYYYVLLFCNLLMYTVMTICVTQAKPQVLFFERK